MFRSPQQLRSGTKGQPVPLAPTTDKRKLVRSLSASSPSSTTMGPTDKANKIDQAAIVDAVNKHLASADVIGQLVAKLSAELRSVVHEAVQEALTAVHQQVEQLRSEVVALTRTVQQLDERLVARTDELEQYQRRNNLRVFGVEERAGEDTDRIVAELCSEKLGVDLPVTAICRSHRVGGQPRPGPDGTKRPRPIIVRFVSYRDRRAVYGAKKRLKGTGVTVREDLTAQRMELLRRVTAIHGIRNTWTQDGRVLWVDKDGVRGAATQLKDIQPSTQPLPTAASG